MKTHDLYHLEPEQLARISKEELYEEYRLLYQEVLASRQAASITADLVVKQIARVEEMNHSLEKANEELRRLTTLDGLTGIPNRRYHDDKLDREWRRCQRNKTPLAAIMIDIDQFKRYNDQYGHLAGDNCLRRVATVLQKAIRRPSDSVARYGGEEFVCLLPDANAEAAHSIALLLRDRIRDLAIAHEASSVSPVVTVSQGIAAMFPSRDTQAADLIEKADHALYQAKQQGRNRIVIFGGFTANSRTVQPAGTGTGERTAP